MAAFEYLDAVVTHAVDTVGHGEGEGVLAALAGIPAEHGGGMGIGVGDKGAAVAQQGEVDVVTLAAAIGEESVVFAGTQVDLLGFGFALRQAAAEMFVQPGTAVFFTYDGSCVVPAAASCRVRLGQQQTIAEWAEAR